MTSRQRFLRKTIKAGEFILRTANINAGKLNITKFVTLHFYVKAIKLAKGISNLCGAGLISDAKILYRPLFEAANYCEYILININDPVPAENILAVAALEDKNTEDKIEKYGGIDIDRIIIDQNEKSDLKLKALRHSQNRLNNYDFIVERLRKRSQAYVNLSGEQILAKEGICNKAFLEKVNQIFNEETGAKDMWKKYKAVFRDCSKSVHVMDFATNVTREEHSLKCRFEERRNTAEVIMEGASTFLIRIMDITNDVFEFKAEQTIKKLFNEARRVNAISEGV